MVIILGIHRCPETAVVAVVYIVGVGQNVFDEIRGWLIAGRREIIVPDMIPVISNEFVELRMDRRFASHDPDDAFETLHGIDGLFERLEIHEERLFVMAAETCTVRAPLRAGVRDLDLDNLHIRGRLH